jgi:hypothetical protein
LAGCGLWMFTKRKMISAAKPRHRTGSLICFT